MKDSSWYGRLEIVCGPMYAAKTTKLLQSAYWCKDHLNRAIIVLKPALDKRYSTHEIVSHDGIRLPADSVSEWPAIPDHVGHVFIDEVQFFDRPWFKGDLPAEVRSLLRRGIDVMACGLDMDWRGQPFRVTAELLAMADHVHKATAICHECGAPATKNFKIVPNELTVEVGAGDKYQARCNRHWHDHTD